MNVKHLLMLINALNAIIIIIEYNIIMEICMDNVNAMMVIMMIIIIIYANNALNFGYFIITKNIIKIILFFSLLCSYNVNDN